MSIPVVADADTLFAATTRGLLIHLDYHGLVKLHWSPLILDELSRALVDTGRKQTLKEAKAHEARMCDALPNALLPAAAVQGHFATVVSSVRSAKDTHVAACAYCLIAAKAYPGASAVALVSRNSKDFRKTALARLGVALHKPDGVPPFPSGPEIPTTARDAVGALGRGWAGENRAAAPALTADEHGRSIAPS